MPVPAKRRTGDEAARRQLGWLMSLCGVVLVLGNAPLALKQLDEFELWWSLISGLVLVLVVALAAFGRVLAFGVLRVLWVAAPLAAVIAYLTWAPAFQNEAGLGDTIPWLWTIEPVFICYPVLIFRGYQVIVFTLASALTPLLSALAFTGTAPTMVVDLTPIHLGNVAFVVLFLGILNRLTRLLAAEARARVERDRAIRTGEMARQQTSLARMVHDEVLSTLVGVSYSGGSISPELRAGAQRAATVLSAAPQEGGDADPVISCEHILGLLEGATRSAADDLEFRGHTGDSTLRVPTEVVHALCGATAEAARNALRHGSGTSPIRVVAILDEHRLTVRVLDDGPGFDPASTSPARLGLRLSVIERMEGVGGRATVTSAPGAGTTVELTWPR